MQQLYLKFPYVNSYLPEDFVIAPANQDAYAFIESWPNWNNQRFGQIGHIYGAKASGKTHLAKIWQSKAEAQVITAASIANLSAQNLILEDIDELDSEFLLHLINLVQESKQYLLLTSKQSPSNLNIKLADLRSRLLAISSFGVEQPDQDLLKAVLLKYFINRQIVIQYEWLDYILLRIERSFEMLKNFIEELEELCKTDKKNVSLKYIKIALENIN